MAIINGLIVAVFLILVAASVAVVGSMIVLATFDLVLGTTEPSSSLVPNLNEGLRCSLHNAAYWLRSMVRPLSSTM